MKYKANVDQEFYTMLKQKIAEDTRDHVDARIQWSFEFPEWALSKIPSSGHTRYEGFEYDTDHEFFGKCDFKYHNKDRVLRLTPYVYENIKKGNIDTFITWKWLERNPREPLELGETVKFELIMYINAETVYNSAEYNEERQRYEYFYS